MKNQNGFLRFVLLLVILVIVVGFYIYKSDQKTLNINENKDFQKQITPEVGDESVTNTKNEVVIKKIDCNKYYDTRVLISCSVSPDGKWAVGEAPNYGGLRIIEGATGIVSVLSNDRYAVYQAWFSDSERLLGFYGTFPSMDCEGNNIDCPRGVIDNRDIVIWNIKSKTYTTVPVETPALSWNLEWIIKDRTVNISSFDPSGSEGDNLYHILDLDTNTIK